MTREEFLKKAESLFVSKERYMEMVNIALDSGLIDLKKCKNDFSDVYPIATAIYEKETKWFLDGSSDGFWRDRARRKATEVRQMFYHPQQYIENFYEKYPKF